MLKYSSRTNIGLVRKLNEDSYVINQDINLMAVADGMGGHKAGEVASGLAVKALEANLFRRQDILSAEPQKALRDAMQAANQEVYESANDNSEQKGMGTTLTAALFQGKYLYLAHVGDSRAYLIRDGQITQITSDHSLVGEMLKKGGLTEEEADKHPQKNILTRALGTSAQVEIDLYKEKIKKGDLLVLCSDGLSNLVHRDEIRELAALAPDMDRLAAMLVDKALERGGYDNITVVIGQA